MHINAFFSKNGTKNSSQASPTFTIMPTGDGCITAIFDNELQKLQQSRSQESKLSKKDLADITNYINELKTIADDEKVLLNKLLDDGLGYGGTVSSGYSLLRLIVVKSLAQYYQCDPTDITATATRIIMNARTQMIRFGAGFAINEKDRDVQIDAHMECIAAKTNWPSVRKAIKQQRQEQNKQEAIADRIFTL